MARRGAYGKASGDRRSRIRPSSWLEANPVTALSFVVATMFLVGTPQVREILFDLPPVSSLGADAEGRAAVALWIYFVVLAGAYLLVAWSLLDPRPIEEEIGERLVGDGFLVRLRRRARRIQRLVVPLLGLLLVRPAERLPLRMRRLFGALLFVTGAATLGTLLIEVPVAIKFVTDPALRMLVG